MIKENNNNNKKYNNNDDNNNNNNDNNNNDNNMLFSVQYSYLLNWISNIELNASFPKNDGILTEAIKIIWEEHS